ncbi:MAG: hypothetical protein KGI38_08260 [Thaumarchaeota archaeon]|nr:hypothetical protein [Nitrososphaerota archaeon]
MSGQPSEPERIVRSLFSVKQSFVLPDGELEFQVGYDDGTKGKFAELKAQLMPLGFRPELTGSADECVLVLRRAETTPRKLSRLPVLLALFTLASLVFTALLQQSVYHDLVPSMPDYVSFLGFGATVAVLLGVHELGQRLVGRSRDAGRASSYLIPGVPLITSFLPSLGFAGWQREPALNRDSLFDAVIAGPLAMLGLAILLYAVGDITSVQSAVPFSSSPLANTTISINPSVVQLAVDSLLGPVLRSVPAGYAAVSPMADGATIGFVLVFFGLLPMAVYDGGLMASAAWGPKAARAASYLSVLALLTLDTPNYWAVAIVALLLVGRPHQLKLSDEVSGLSSSRQWLFVGTLVLAFLCVPVPHNIANFPLP